MTMYKLFCDESCHLEHDKADVMVLGALHCSAQQAVLLSKKIKYLKHKHHYLPELKWAKLNKHQWALYRDLIDLLVQDDALCFKATVVPNKQALDHATYNQHSHNDFYYKMFYFTLRNFLSVGHCYRVYLDFMDTHGAYKSKKLAEVLQRGTNWQLDVEFTIIRSYESVLMQLCDLLIGAVAYKNRSDIAKTSPIKNQFVAYLEQALQRPLDQGTPSGEAKFNIFQFQPRGATHNAL